MTGSGTAVVRVHREGPVWRWTYEAATGGEVRLTSSIAFTGAAEAEDAARTAYPEAEVVVEGVPPQSRPARRPRRLVPILVALAGAAVLVPRLRRAPARVPPARTAAASDLPVTSPVRPVDVRVGPLLSALAWRTGGDLRNAWDAGAARGRRKTSERYGRGR